MSRGAAGSGSRGLRQERRREEGNDRDGEVAQGDGEDVGQRYEQLAVSVVVEDGDGRGR